MKCTICGQEMSPNDQFCLNCGTKRSEMNSTFGSNPNAGQQYSYGGNGFSNTSYKPVKSGSLVAVRIIISLLILAIGFGIFIAKDRITHKVDCGSFTIKLPMSCKEDDDYSDLTAGLDYGTNAGGYGNDNIEFAYVEYDMSEVGEEVLGSTDMTSLFISYMDGALSASEKGYSKVSSSKNKLKCTYTNNYSQKVYAIITCETHGDKLYMFMFLCENSDRGKYETKLEEYADTITFK